MDRLTLALSGAALALAGSSSLTLSYVANGDNGPHNGNARKVIMATMLAMIGDDNALRIIRDDRATLARWRATVGRCAMRARKAPTLPVTGAERMEHAIYSGVAGMWRSIPSLAVIRSRIVPDGKRAGLPVKAWPARMSSMIEARYGMLESMDRESIPPAPAPASKAPATGPGKGIPPTLLADMLADNRATRATLAPAPVKAPVKARKVKGA
jgi:hypothetical protein